MKELDLPGGRFCPLTEEDCMLEVCKSDCDGINVARELKSLTKILSWEHFADTYSSTVANFPQETQREIMQFLDPQRGLEIFENFFENKI